MRREIVLSRVEFFDLMKCFKPEARFLPVEYAKLGIDALLVCQVVYTTEALHTDA